jgi:hypothetical protein
MTVIAAQSVRRCQAPFDSRHRPGRQIASLQGCRDLRRMPAAASPKIRAFEHPRPGRDVRVFPEQPQAGRPGFLDQAGMRAGQALAGVASISLLHEHGMNHSGLRSGHLAPGRCSASPGRVRGPGHRTRARRSTPPHIAAVTAGCGQPPPFSGRPSLPGLNRAEGRVVKFEELVIGCGMLYARKLRKWQIGDCAPDLGSCTRKTRGYTARARGFFVHGQAGKMLRAKGR